MVAKALKEAVERLHNCKARATGAEHVIETFRGETVWDGPVTVFALEGHPKASICYAWVSPVQGSTRRRFSAVLKQKPVNTPQDAVRAAIVHSYRESQQGS